MREVGNEIQGVLRLEAADVSFELRSTGDNRQKMLFVIGVQCLNRIKCFGIDIDISLHMSHVEGNMCHAIFSIATLTTSVLQKLRDMRIDMSANNTADTAHDPFLRNYIELQHGCIVRMLLGIKSLYKLGHAIEESVGRICQFNSGYHLAYILHRESCVKTIVRFTASNNDEVDFMVKTMSLFIRNLLY